MTFLLRLEHVSCDLCGSDDYIVRYRKPDNWLWSTSFEYPVVQCSNCGLVFVNPRPTFSEMRAFYPAGYHDTRDDELHWIRYEAQYEYVQSFRSKRILDIGCARGDWLRFLAGKWNDSEFHGIDAFSDGVNFESMTFNNCQLVNAKLPSSYFDLITSWAVFEHLHSPSEHFEAASNALHPGGRLVILVTNSESVYGRYAYKEDIPRHLHHFSEKTLTRYAHKHGLVIEAISFDDRFWDGTGKGAFRHMLRRLVGVSWKDVRDGKLAFPQRVALKLGDILDRLVFFSDWERRLKRSGIMVATLRKPG